jgi:hemoglobin-like flavoprotein
MEIHESIQEIFRNERRVAELFYGLFLERYPEARPYFEGIDLKRQAVLLTMALMLVEHHYVHLNRVTEDYLRVLGYQHHVRRGIPAELYPPFCECLLVALEQSHGEAWEPRLAEQWREALEMSSRIMLQGYQGHHPV